MYDPRCRLGLCGIACLALGASLAVAQGPEKPPAQEKGEKPADAKSPTAAPSTGLESPKATATKADEFELALRGYCPVSYHTDGKAVLGDPQFSVMYHGFVYHLADAEKKKRFEEDPEKYIPRIGGLCVVALGGPYGNRFRSDPRVFGIVQGKLYLCSSERAKRSFDLKPEHYAERAEELFRKPELRGHCPVSIYNGSAAMGSESFAYVYQGMVYHLQSADALAEFIKDPGRYVPRYQGFCASNVAQGKLLPGDPTVAATIDGHVYLFLKIKEKERCLAGGKSCIPDADAKWVELEKNLRKAPGGS